MHWVALFLAGLFEVCWAVGLKMTDGFSKLLPSIVTIVGTILSFALLSVAMKKLPLSMAYAIWTGIGTVGTVLFGVFYFHEPITLPRIICVAMIVVGIMGLKFLN